MAKPVHAAIGDTWIHCLICDNNTFREREVKLNSSGMEFLGLAWANESATGLICWSCGHVQLFVSRHIAFYRANK